MKPVIEVQGLSKSYIINHKDRANYRTLKDDFTNLITSPISKRQDHEEKFWALKDISFSVNPGEIFGIVGRNGSGKSTLLKILSRIVEPTSGIAKLNGRVASLLEVGTGFHPELTGRENIFFNGSMLGMSRKEIQLRYKDIVEFSEVEKFIDTPVKFYSSGMYVRLAFAVAAHLDPDILILDEVLAVGDAGFQKKSLQRILSIMQSGSTILFVSHGMGTVEKLCNRGLMLKDGKVDFIGPSGALTEHYMQSMRKEEVKPKVQSSWKSNNEKNEYFSPKEMYIVDDDGKRIHSETKNNKDLWLCITGNLQTDSELFNIGYTVHSLEQANKPIIYMTLSTDGRIEEWPKLKTGEVTFRGKIPKHLLNGGRHQISLIASLHNKKWIFDPEENTPSIELLISEKLDISRMWTGTRSGLTAPVIPWTIQQNGSTSGRG